MWRWWRFRIIIWLGLSSYLYVYLCFYWERFFNILSLEVYGFLPFKVSCVLLYFLFFDNFGVRTILSSLTNIMGYLPPPMHVSFVFVTTHILDYFTIVGECNEETLFASLCNFKQMKTLKKKNSLQLLFIQNIRNL